jgi:hypothetical protein
MKRPLFFLDAVVLVPLTKGLVAQIDFMDIDKLDDGNWCAFVPNDSNTAYACRAYGNKNVLLHRRIMDAPPGVEVDHRDTNGLNCRRHNLRFCTRQQNSRNKAVRQDSRSGLKGAIWDNRAGKWKAEIWVSGRSKYLGLFSSAAEAHAAYRAAALTEFGEFARMA